MRLSQWWVGLPFLYGPYEIALIDVPFWVGTGALVLLVVFSIAMRWLGRWQNEWFIVLCVGSVAWLGIVFTLIIVSGLIEF